VIQTAIENPTYVPRLVTYPARPMNGGPLRRGSPSHSYEPKWNGWRAMVHIDTGTFFNRQGELLSIAHEFQDALRILREKQQPELYSWADCEALSRRHGFGKGTLILLDVVPELAHREANYLDRRAWLEARFATADITKPVAGRTVLLSPSCSDGIALWTKCARINKLFPELYEGVIAKRADSVYPVQRISATRETHTWIKHRWY
jgi:ATP-dependent DNA ligase